MYREHPLDQLRNQLRKEISHYMGYSEIKEQIVLPNKIETQTGWFASISLTVTNRRFKYDTTAAVRFHTDFDYPTQISAVFVKTGLGKPKHQNRLYHRGSSTWDAHVLREVLEFLMLDIWPEEIRNRELPVRDLPGNKPGPKKRLLSF